MKHGYILTFAFAELLLGEEVTKKEINLNFIKIGFLRRYEPVNTEKYYTFFLIQ